MIETLTGIIPGSPGAEALYRFRHRVFVEHAGWELPCYGPLEFDEFDTPQAVYLVRRHAESRIAGMLRLLPTTQPYMIQSLWPELMGSHPIPSSPRVWEATRMGVDPDMDPLSRGQTVAELVAGCLEYGTQHGIDQMLAVMSEAHARKIVTGMGWSYERCGPLRLMGGVHVMAVRLRLDDTALQSVLRRTRTQAGLLHENASPLQSAPCAQF